MSKQGELLTETKILIGYFKATIANLEAKRLNDGDRIGVAEAKCQIEKVDRLVAKADKERRS